MINRYVHTDQNSYGGQGREFPSCTILFFLLGISLEGQWRYFSGLLAVHKIFFFLHNLFCNSFPPPPPTLGVLGGHPLGKQTTVKILGKYNFARGFWWAYKWGGGGGRGAMPAVLISAINIISKRADKKYAYCQT